jgi:hypothetical protein
MHTSLEIHPTKNTREGFALTRLFDSQGNRICLLDIEYSRLAILPKPHPCAVDLLLLAAAVYAMDKLVPRSAASDGWTRELSLTLPVSDPSIWSTLRDRVNTCLSFLTGDVWTVEYVERPRDPVRPRKPGGTDDRIVALKTVEAVCLFSGGLDSLVGAVDWLEANAGRNVLLMGHHERRMPGPLSDQERLLGPLQLAYPQRIQPILARVGHMGEREGPVDITLRGRSLLFIALGVLAASAGEAHLPLIVPENGMIALNIPLTPSRRGSCSTRTAHPFYMSMVQEIVTSLGLKVLISNPLEGKTKGEVVRSCLNQSLLKQIASLSVSCAKRGRKNHWKRRSARACGHCMPCIYRRAALYSAGWDDEVYGNDVCAGEVDLEGDGDIANDLRACFTFLRRKPNLRAIESLLMASGRLEVRRLSQSAKIVERAMEEIRRLIRDKALPRVKNAAGIT